MNDVSPARFERHVKVALAQGRRFVPADEIARTGGRPGDLAITFDDGLASVAVHAAPVLSYYDIPWSLFVVSNWADGIHDFADGLLLGWRDIERMARQGAVIGSHSLSHADFGRIPPEAMRHELGESRRVIESRLGITATSFAIPFGQSRNWSRLAGATAQDAGYEIVYAQSVERRTPGATPRTFITCFDGARNFRSALMGAYDRWEEWL
ncbi:MAG: polysaccharide deacetylase family protein [Dehalococcoidia bacterium]